MNPAGNPELGFIYLCIGAMGIAAIGLAIKLIYELVNDFAKLVAMHARGWK